MESGGFGRIATPSSHPLDRIQHRTLHLGEGVKSLAAGFPPGSMLVRFWGKESLLNFPAIDQLLHQPLANAMLPQEILQLRPAHHHRIIHGFIICG